MPDDRGTRPHYHISNLLHGAVKDVGEAHGIEHGEAYEVAAMLLVALEQDVPFSPESADEDVQAALEDLLAECEGVESGASTN